MPKTRARFNWVIEKMFKFKILLLVMFVSGCVTVKNPMPGQVSGNWENVNLVYSRLVLNSEGNGYLVFAGKEGKSEIYLVNDFNSVEEGFTVNLIDLADREAEPEPLKGTLYEFGSLCLEDIDTDDTEEICYMKTSDIEQSRNTAIQALQNLNNKTRNEMNGSDEPPIR